MQENQPNAAPASTPDAPSPPRDPSATLPPAKPYRANRFDSIDILRGFALLGILPMNMVSFAMPETSMFSMKALDPLFPYEGLNRWVHNLTTLFFDMKMMSIFSMLFGVGVLLFAGKARSREELATVRGRWFRRCGWMMTFGMLHAYLIWHGDILVLYATCGLLFLWWVRRWSPAVLAAVGGCAILFGAFIWVLMGLSLNLAPPEAIVEVTAMLAPTAEQIQDKVDIFQSGWSAIQPERAAFAIESQLYIPFFGWINAGLMLIGMALYKWNIVTAQRSIRFYAVMAAICYAIGLPLVWYSVMLREQLTGDAANLFAFGMLPNVIGSLPVALGHIATIMLIVKLGALQAVQRVLAAVGRTAFSNYIFQSVVATLIFYGYGFGLYGQLDRPQQWFVVLGIWAVQITLTLLWLRAFQFGPLEWLWRCLTYWRLLPISKLGSRARHEHA